MMMPPAEAPAMPDAARVLQDAMLEGAVVSAAMTMPPAEEDVEMMMPPAEAPAMPDYRRRRLDEGAMYDEAMPMPMPPAERRCPTRRAARSSRTTTSTTSPSAPPRRPRARGRSDAARLRVTAQRRAPPPLPPTASAGPLAADASRPPLPRRRSNQTGRI